MEPFSSSSPIFSAEEEELAFNGELPFLIFSPDLPFDPLSVSSSSLLNYSSPPILRRSAFSNYTKPMGDIISFVQNGNGGGLNVHRRVIEILRGLQRGKVERDREKNGRDFQHMMRERLRRERLSQSYADLHAMLPLGTKACKNSILKSTVMMVRELMTVKQEQQQRNHELFNMLKSTATMEGSSEPSDEVEIKIKMPNMTSTVDSMINALHCFEGLDVKIRAVRSEHSSEGVLELIMTVQIQICDVLQDQMRDEQRRFLP